MTKALVLSLEAQRAFAMHKAMERNDHEETLRLALPQAYGGGDFAMSLVGTIYSMGFDKYPSYVVKAWAWTSLAADRGHPLAINFLPTLKAVMSPESLEEAAREKLRISHEMQVRQKEMRR